MVQSAGNLFMSRAEENYFDASVASMGVLPVSLRY